MKKLAFILFFLVTLLLGPVGCGGSSDGGGLNESNDGLPLPALPGAVGEVPGSFKYGDIVVLKSSYWRTYLSAQEGEAVKNVVVPGEWEQWQVFKAADPTSTDYVRFNEDVVLKSKFRRRYLTSVDDTWVHHAPSVGAWEHWRFKDPADPSSNQLVTAQRGVALHSTAHGWYLTGRQEDNVGQSEALGSWERWNILPRDYVRPPDGMLHYGDVLTLQSPFFHGYLSAQQGDRVEVVRNTQAWEQWEIVDAATPDSTAPVAYGDHAALYAIGRGRFVSAQDGGRTKQVQQLQEYERWRIVDPESPDRAAGTIAAMATVNFKSPHFGTYLSAQDGTAEHVATSAEYEKWKALPPAYLRNWMSAESAIHGKKLREITFPASHDAATWQFRDVFSNDPDAATFTMLTTVVDDFVSALTTIRIGAISFDVTGGLANQLKDFGLHKVYASVAAFAKATDRDIAQQLASGIRWLDLRPDLRPEGAYSHHLLVGVKMETVIDQVADFVKTTNGEIVVLEMTHFYPDDAYSRFDDFAKMVSTKLDGHLYQYVDDTTKHPLDMTYSELVGNEKKSKVIVFTHAGWELYPHKYKFWHVDDLGLTGEYANKSFRELVIADQKDKFSKRKTGDAFRLYLTLTGDPYTELLPRAAYLMYDGYRHFAFDLIKPYIEALVPDWFGARSAALDALRSFIDSAVHAVLAALLPAPLYSLSDWLSLEELSQKINHDLGDVMLQFQDGNKTGYNEITVVYADYAHTTDLVERAIAWSKKPSR